MYGRRPVAPPPPLPLCRGLATAVGHEAETIESTNNATKPKIKESKNRGGEGPRPGRRYISGAERRFLLAVDVAGRPALSAAALALLDLLCLFADKLERK